MDCLREPQEQADPTGTGPQVRSVINSALRVKHGCENEHTKSFHSVHLGEGLHSARLDGILGDVLKEAVKYKVLREVVCRAVEDDVFEEVFIESHKRGLLQKLVLNCRRFSVPLVKAAINCGLLVEVLSEAAEGNVLTKVLDGVFRCGVLAEDDVFEQVFIESYKCGLLKDLVVSCRRFSVPLVKAAINCGLLVEVLSQAVRGNVLTNVLDGVFRCGVLAVLKVLTETELIERRELHEVVTEVVHGAWSRGMMTEVLMAAMKGDQLSDVLQTTAECGGVTTVLAEATEIGLLMDLLTEARERGLLATVLRSCKSPDPPSYAFVPRQYVTCNITIDPIMHASLSSRVLEREIQSTALKLEIIGMKLRADILKGKLSKTMNRVKFSKISWGNIIDELSDWQKKWACATQKRSTFWLKFRDPPISRDEILQAAEKQDLVEEVLEAERINDEGFELFHTLIACILLLFVTVNKKPRTHSLGTSSHRKSVIDHVTIRSGDIEKNPGPCTLKLNDWLKSMHLFIVDLMHGHEGKRISWKKLGLPDPNNSKFDHSELLELFPDQLLQDAEARIPAANYEEFQLLKAHIKSGQKPDLCHVQHLMNIRKLTAECLKVFRKLTSQSQAVQHGVINNLTNNGLQLTVLDHRQETPDGGETGEAARDGEGGVDSQSNDPSGTGSVNQTENGLQTNQCGELARRESSVGEKEVDEKNRNPGEERGISDHQEEQEALCDGDLTEIYNWLGQFLETDCDFEHDTTVEGVSEAQAVCQSGTDATEDPLQQLLNYSDKPSTDTIQAVHSSTQDTTVTVDTPEPCQDDTTGTCTLSQDKQTSATILPDQHTHWGYLVRNLKLFTGMEELDKREYDVDEIGKLSGKRKWCQHEVFETVKQAKRQ